MTEERYYQFNVIDVDALHDGEGWYWDDMRQLEAGVVFTESSLTPDKILKKLREWGYLNDYSKGRVSIDMSCDECIEIQEKGTGRPIYALSQLHGDPIPETMR